MEKSDILKLDGQQLQLFLEIYNAGSVTGASRVLDLNQSTVTYWLEILRKRFDDPLFIRTGHGVTPTSKATDLVPLIQDILAGYDDLSAIGHYDPQTDRGVLVVGTTMGERDVLTSAFLKTALRLAPNMNIDFRPTGSFGPAAEDLEMGRADFVLLPEGALSGDNIMQRAVLSYQSAVFYDQSYPLLDTSYAAYCSRKHIRLMLGPEMGFAIDKRLEQLNLTRRSAVQVADFDSALRLIHGTDLIATVPMFLKDIAGKGLCFCKPPWGAEDERLTLYWHRRNKDSERSQFWRKQVIDAAAKFAAKPES